MSLEIDPRALVPAIFFAFACTLLSKLKEKFMAPQIYVSTIKNFPKIGISWREYFSEYPRYLQYIALTAFTIAIVDPRIYIARNSDSSWQDNSANQAAIKGIAIYLVLDQSGSMTEQIDVLTQEGLPRRQKKIDFLRDITKRFIKGDASLGLKGRPSDLIGLVEFARTAQVAAPLTLDHQSIIEQLEQFQPISNKEMDGTAIGYAIYKTASLIAATRQYAQDLNDKGKPAYEIKNSIILLVTDGLQDPNPLDIGSRWRQISPLDAAQYAKEKDVRLYIVNIEPKFSKEQYAANRRQMTQAAESTGGKFYIINNHSSLANVYTEIDHLEKSDLPVQQELLEKLKQLSKSQLPTLYKNFPLYPYLIALGMLCLLASLFLETTYLRKTP